MDTKKTILVSVVTTLATMFVVAMIMHMCRSNCGKRTSCSKTAYSQCSHSYGQSSCASYSSCSSKTSCSKKSKWGKCSKSASKCCKKSCTKTSCKSGDVKTCKYKDGEKVIIKKTVTVEDEK